MNLPANIPLNFVAMRQTTAEGQSDMEVRMKQRCVIEFLHAEKIAPNDIHRRLLNVYGDQTVDVSTVRRWVARFSSGDSDVKDKPRSGTAMHSCHTTKRRASRSAHPRVLVDYD